MNKIIEIIKAATQGAWNTFTQRNKYVYVGVGTPEDGVKVIHTADISPYNTSAVNKQAKDNAAFIATFNPEHVALMEAVIQNIDFYDGGICRWCGAASLNPHLPDCEMYMLEAYRKERGLL